jgi:hypothetical protein
VRILGLILVTLALAGCSLVASPPPAAYDIHVDNGTGLDVAVLANGSRVGSVAPGSSVTVPAARVGGLPWHVEAVTAETGRLLISFDVEEGSVGATGSSESGIGGRVDLSCGRLDVYVGPPLLGPAPGPGIPGDCEP